MKKMLLKETKTYQVETENDAKELIEEFSQNQFANHYKVVDSKYTYKNKKAKGEIIDEWYLVTVIMSYEVE